MKHVYIGNVLEDIQDTRGWFVGHFVSDPHSLRFSNDVEIKWGVHKKGERRDGWSINETATTMSLVIHGKVTLTFNDEIVTLTDHQYFISKPGIPHTYSMDEDTLIITVRWPSFPTDHQNVNK